jgi:ethanolamine utilization protein EutN
MRIAQVIGTVTLSYCDPSLEGATWRIGVPLKAEALSGGSEGRGEPFVIYDEQNSGNGDLIAVSESAEAAAPFHPEQKPVDAYNAAILDVVNVES